MRFAFFTQTIRCSTLFSNHKYTDSTTHLAVAVADQFRCMQIVFVDAGRTGISVSVYMMGSRRAQECGADYVYGNAVTGGQRINAYGKKEEEERNTISIRNG